MLNIFICKTENFFYYVFQFFLCDESICSIRDSARRRQTCNASFRGRRATSPQRLASHKNKKTFSLLLINFEQVIYSTLNRQMIHSGAFKSIT